MVGLINPELNQGAFYDTYSGEPPNHYYNFGVHDTIVFKSQNEFEYSSITNNYGFFDRSFPEAFDDKTIVVFGDSYTQGVGADSTETWPRYLQQCLNENNNQWSVFNCGIAGCDPIFNFVVFRDLILSKKPEHVMLCINETDVWDLISRGGMERFRKDGTVRYKSPSFKYRLFRSSYLFRYGCINLLNYNYLGMTDAETENSIKQAKIVLQNLVQEFSSLAFKNGIEFTLITMPFPTPPIPATANETSMNFQVSPSIHTIDLFSYFNEDSVIQNIDSYYWKNDGHFTALGYLTFANGVCAQINAN